MRSLHFSFTCDQKGIKTDVFRAICVFKKSLARKKHFLTFIFFKPKKVVYLRREKVVCFQEINYTSSIHSIKNGNKFDVFSATWVLKTHFSQTFLREKKPRCNTWVFWSPRKKRLAVIFGKTLFKTSTVCRRYLDLPLASIS